MRVLPIVCVCIALLASACGTIMDQDTARLDTPSGKPLTHNTEDGGKATFAVTASVAADTRAFAPSTSTAVLTMFSQNEETGDVGVAPTVIARTQAFGRSVAGEVSDFALGSFQAATIPLAAHLLPSSKSSTSVDNSNDVSQDQSQTAQGGAGGQGGKGVGYGGQGGNGYGGKAFGGDVDFNRRGGGHNNCRTHGGHC